jgi:hypothetical protein
VGPNPLRQLIQRRARIGPLVLRVERALILVKCQTTVSMMRVRQTLDSARCRGAARCDNNASRYCRKDVCLNGLLTRIHFIGSQEEPRATYGKAPERPGKRGRPCKQGGDAVQHWQDDIGTRLPTAVRRVSTATMSASGTKRTFSRSCREVWFRSKSGHA